MQRPGQRLGAFDAGAALVGLAGQRHRLRRVAVIGLEQRQLQIYIRALRLEEPLHGAHKAILRLGVVGAAGGLVQLAKRDHILWQRHAPDRLLVQLHGLRRVALGVAHARQARKGVNIAGQPLQAQRIGALCRSQIADAKVEIAELHTRPLAVLQRGAACVDRHLHRLDCALRVAVELAQIGHPAV